MLTVGEGIDLWHVRVDLIAPDRDGDLVSRVADELRSELRGEHRGHGCGAGVDQGKGVEGRAVIGLTFWVRADDLAQAASTALETARRVGHSADIGPDYYGVTLVPRSAVKVDPAEHEMQMPS